MDVHRVIIGDQYYLFVAFNMYPICCIMNEQMILVNQQLKEMVKEDRLVLCVHQSSPSKDLLEQRITACSVDDKEKIQQQIRRMREEKRRLKKERYLLSLFFCFFLHFVR